MFVTGLTFPNNTIFLAERQLLGVVIYLKLSKVTILLTVTNNLERKSGRSGTVCIANICIFDKQLVEIGQRIAIHESR